MTLTENKLQLGIGIYTVTEIAHILNIPRKKVDRWLREYWEGELGNEFAENYSWKTDGSKAVGFHTLIEFYVMVQFSEAGVQTRKLLDAHKTLSEWYNTPFPFAQKEVLENMKTDKTRIYFQKGDDLVTLDNTKQLNFKFIEIFFKNIEFDSNQLAARLWPLGKEKSIVIDPKRKFGHPVIDEQNIYPETICNHINAGDPVKYIAYVYEITEQQVAHAVEYCNAA
jgi:uncharacterized protein (DUF433 family)